MTPSPTRKYRGRNRCRTVPTGTEPYKPVDDSHYIEMVSSPCSNVCTVDDGVCTACNRTLGEIASWAAMTEAERKARMQELRVSVDSP